MAIFWLLLTPWILGEICKYCDFLYGPKYRRDPCGGGGVETTFGRISPAPTAPQPSVSILRIRNSACHNAWFCTVFIIIFSFRYLINVSVIAANKTHLKTHQYLFLVFMSDYSEIYESMTGSLAIAVQIE